MAKVAVGRKSGFFRSRIYDHIFDEADAAASLPTHFLDKERAVQKAVLSLAGIVMTQTGDALPDLSASIALDLPPLSQSTYRAS